MNSKIDISTTQRVVLNDQVLTQQLGGESVMLHLDKEMYYGLDEVGTRMLSVLGESSNLQAAYDALLGEYDVAPDRLRQDLVKLIEQCLEHGLVKVTPA